MKYTPAMLRLGINNANNALLYFAQIAPENMTRYDILAVELNLKRIDKFKKMLTVSKGYSYS